MGPIININIIRYLIYFLLSLICLPRTAEGQETRAKLSLPMISAHRGASRVAPENTLKAFSKAIEQGADFIEIDVRTTADGMQVVMHDGSLKRTTGLDAKVEKTDLSTIKNLSAGNWFGKAYKDEKVPTLEAVCELVAAENKHSAKQVKLYVDCKAIDARQVVSILSKHNVLDSAVFYGDLHPLVEIKKLCKAARLMPSFPGKNKMENVIDTLAPYAVDISYDELNSETVSFCHARGIKVFCDLLGQDDSPDTYRKAILTGLDLIQTDDVTAVRQTFKEFIEPVLK